METYVVELMMDVEYSWDKLFETSDLEEAKAFARKKQTEINWSDGSPKDFRRYITLDKYRDGVLIETVEF